MLQHESLRTPNEQFPVGAQVYGAGQVQTPSTVWLRWRGIVPDDADFGSPQDGLSAIARGKFQQDLLDMVLDRIDADVEQFSDFFVCLAVVHPLDDLDLPGSERPDIYGATASPEGSCQGREEVRSQKAQGLFAAALRLRWNAAETESQPTVAGG